MGSSSWYLTSPYHPYSSSYPSSNTTPYHHHHSNPSSPKYSVPLSTINLYFESRHLSMDVSGDLDNYAYGLWRDRWMWHLFLNFVFCGNLGLCGEEEEVFCFADPQTYSISKFPVKINNLYFKPYFWLPKFSVKY